jgi:predicted house-cleaning noncanonical NTP pyrophosphatase (MazG superfamily)
MPVPGKLVRDRIPDIIRDSGAEPMTRTATPSEYRQRLRLKLREETAEFLAATPETAPEELADVLEVVLALALDMGMNAAQLEKIRAQKAEARGGFGLRTVWLGNVNDR